MLTDCKAARISGLHHCAALAEQLHPLRRHGGHQTAIIGAPTAVESSLVLCARLGRAGKTLLARFLEGAEIDVAELTADHWTVAADAFLRYCKGRHHADLNFGDCMTYAVAKLAGRPLLCLGDDFPATDLGLAVPPRAFPRAPSA